jgi:hypothetical protein
VFKPIVKQPNLWIACAAVLFVSISLEFCGHACGFLLTPDSLQYLSAAKSFSASGKFLSPDGSYYSYWGPLFPIILSFFKQPQDALVWINVFCKIVIAVALLALANSFIKESVLKIVFLIVSMVGVHMALISVFVWSELIFMMVILLNAHFALSLNKNRSNYYWFLITGFLACLQRDAGFFWMCGVCLWLLLDNSATLKTRIIQSAICFSVCTSGLIAWRVYIHFVMHQSSNFYDYSFFFHAFENVQLVLLTFGKMFFPLNGIPGMATGFLFFLLLFWSVLNSTRKTQLLGIIISVYTLGFIALPWQLDVNEMDRYFSVITPLVYLFALSLVDKLQPAKRRVSFLIYTIVLFWLCYPLTRTFINVKAWHERSCSMSDVSK